MSSRRVGAFEKAPHGRTLMGGEPLVMHCNFYNYWLQRTFLISAGAQMTPVIQDAAQVTSHALLKRVSEDLGLTAEDERSELAVDTFAELGFGTLTFQGLTSSGGKAIVPVSHYGTCLRGISKKPFNKAQGLLDAGYAAAAGEIIAGLPVGSFRAHIEACQSLGAPAGLIRLERADREMPFGAVGRGSHAADAELIPAFSVSFLAAGAAAGLMNLVFEGRIRDGVTLDEAFYNQVFESSKSFVSQETQSPVTGEPWTEIVAER